VNQPNVLTVSGAATAFTCGANNAVNTATVTITAANGTPVYTYSIDGVNYTTSNTFSVINNGTVQTITIAAKDSNGCVATNTVTVNPLPSITNATVVRDTAITCTNNETVTISVTGGSGNFNYQLLPGGAPQASNVFNLTAPGNYYFRVNDLTTGCYFDIPEYNIASFNTIQVVASATIPVTCFGDSNGAIAITVSGYSGSYNYQVFDSTGTAYGGVGAGNTTTNPLVIPGLPAGNYTVRVTATQSPFCNVTSNVTTVASPSAAVGLTLVSNINANCTSGAQVTVNGTGGTPGYTYAFAQDGVVPVATDYAASNTATLSPAVNTQWDVYVKDSRGCINFINVTIASDPLPTVTVPTVATDQCTSTGSSYTFTATGTGVAPLTFSVGAGFQSSGTFTVSASGSYTVTVKDANGCTATRTMTIYAPLNLTPTVNVSPSCANNDGQVTVSGAGGSGTYTYSINPNTGITQTGNVFSGVPSGLYTVTITDTDTNCNKAVTIDVTAAIPVNLATPTVINTICNGGSDGTVTINLAPGNTNPVYTYQIIAPFTGVSQTSNVFTGLSARSYTFRVTSGKNCATTQIVDVNQPNAIVVPAPVVTQFGCSPGTNSTNFATIQVSGMTGGSGTYTIYEFKKGTTIVQSGPNTTYTEADLSGGNNYIVTVYDSNGCTGTTTAVINPFIRIENPVVTVTRAITCTSTENITIGITTIGGTPATLNYSVVGLNGNPYNVTQTSPSFTGLTVGEYSIVVENPTTGCSDRTVHYVADPNTFNLDVIKNNDVTCFGDVNGSIRLTIIDTNLIPTNDAGPFTYSITNSAGNTIASGSSLNAGPVTINGLAAGIYQATVTLTSAPFCTSRKAFSIEQPTDALIARATFTNPTCVAGNNDGTISVSASFGWPSVAYEYQLERAPSTIISAWSSTTDYSGLTPDNYIVRVRDSRGCVASTNVRLAVPPPISGAISASPTSLLCLGATNATITVSGVTGGQGSNYLYSLVNVSTGAASGAQPNTIFNNVGAGTYNVIISDAYSCTFTTANVTITAPATNVTARLVKATNATCSVNATITLSASGGTAPYRYSATAGGPYSPLTGSVTLPATAGRYQYYVVDSNNCSEVVSNQIIVEAVVPVNVNVNTATAIINCFGGTTTVTATATDGLGNYVYSLLPVTAGVVQASPGVFTNVPAGNNYIVQVVSGDCRDSVSFTITPPTRVTLVSSTSTNITCNGQTNGTIQVVATGGTGTIQYSISSQPGQTVNSGLFTNLAAGDYTVVYQDEAGCTSTPLEFTILEPREIKLEALEVVQANCLEDKGSISFIVIGGTVTASQGYTATIGTTTQTSLAGSFVFNNLPAARYLISITDANNCPFSFEQMLDAGVDIKPAVVVEYPCTGTTAISTIRVTTNPAIPASEFTYLLDGGAPQPGNTFSNVAQGDHTIEVRHVPSGCVKTVTGIIVNAITPLNLTLAESGLNQFTATATGGAGGYTYTINGNATGSDNVFFINQTGTYTVIVTDTNGCQDTKTIAMTFFDIQIPNFFTPDGLGNNNTWTPLYTDNFPDVITEIYDRYGRKLASLRQGQSWDGRYNNSNLPSGDYWYVVRLNGTTDGRQFVGHFTLYR
jgi:gliding motility-associated-like protein